MQLSILQLIIKENFHGLKIRSSKTSEVEYFIYEEEKMIKGIEYYNHIVNIQSIGTIIKAQNLQFDISSQKQYNQFIEFIHDKIRDSRNGDSW